MSMLRKQGQTTFSPFVHHLTSYAHQNTLLPYPRRRHDDRSRAHRLVASICGRIGITALRHPSESAVVVQTDLVSCDLWVMSVFSSEGQTRMPKRRP
ncbi:unnamed protein product [Protopolystoma xenopodis]|uniref:Uncharacterized protein n=1 Tax=Protopolystoma xenopodis TaxID=117903 RepID=A0A448WIM6_9PLAT|nr:unnamed protein product [Protopolystoma xenopodis]